MSSDSQKVEVSRGALWFGLFGGAIAWTAHLMFAYGTAEFGCVGIGERSYLGVTLVAWIEVALTLVTALASGTATVVAYRIHRGLRSNGALMDAVSVDTAATSLRYTAWAGVLTSGLFTFIILFESIPILYYLHECRS